MVTLNLVYPFLIGWDAVIGEGTWNNRLVPNRKKEFVKAVYCHPVYLTYMQSTS